MAFRTDSSSGKGSIKRKRFQKRKKKRKRFQEPFPNFSKAEKKSGKGSRKSGKGSRSLFQTTTLNFGIANLDTLTWGAPGPRYVFGVEPKDDKYHCAFHALLEVTGNRLLYGVV